MARPRVPVSGKTVRWTIATLLLISPGGCSGEGTGPPSGTEERATLLAVRDNTVYEDAAGSLANGAGDFLFAGRTNSGEIRRALLRFDVAAAGIPSGATVDSVELALNVSRTVVSARPVALHRVTADWGEGASRATGGEGMGAPAEPGDATWIHRFFDTDPWTVAGGDFVPAPSALAQVDGVGPYTWGSTPQMVADVQGWLSDPARSFGWILVGDESTVRTAKRFDSRSHGEEEGRPVLTVYYRAP